MTIINIGLQSKREKFIKVQLPDVELYEEELIEYIEMAELWNISPPPFNMINFECSVQSKQTDPDIISEVKSFISEILSLETRPDKIPEIIERLCYRKQIKNKLTGLIKTDNEGLQKVIAELIHLNLKNFQSYTKEVIEKLILLINFSDSYKSLHNSGYQDLLKTIIKIQKISSWNFSDYYKLFLTENFFYSFVSQIEAGMDDSKVHYLSDTLDKNRWDYNIRVIKNSLHNGNQYINTNKNRVILKIMAEFGDNYIPKKTRSLKYLKSIIANYFTPSNWRKRISFILKYYILHKSGNHLRFESCKDSSMALRFFAGGDCSADMNSPLADTASVYYKIFLNDEWIGYVTLLSVKTENDHKAILIDVINIKKSILECDFSIADFFDYFIDGLIERSGIDGHKYLLISAHPEFLSDSETYIIYEKYGRYPEIKEPLLLYRGKDKEYAKDYLTLFQSLKSESYIIIRDFENYCKGILPGCE